MRIKYSYFIFLMILFYVSVPKYIFAQPSLKSGILLSQSINDDSYDPFADYSEFEESNAEEADINFFRNGRLLTVGLSAGYCGFTSAFNAIYKPSFGFGISLAYFFDLRFALQVSFMNSSHILEILYTENGASQSAKGTHNMNLIAFDLKYYLNTQNVTRGLANLNPYLVLGLNKMNETSEISDHDAYAQDHATGFSIGGGIEFPMLRNQFYFGLQATYYYASLMDENQQIYVKTVATKIVPEGDLYSINGILGVNF